MLHEGLALRVARAVNHLRATLMAGFTTIRDLGTEGAGYADVELKQAVDQGIIPGPRMLASTRAIVATGSYAPKGFALEWRVPQGAEEADGVDSAHPRRARPDRPRRRLDQGLRRLPLGRAAGRAPDVLARRDEARRRDREERGRPVVGPREHGRRACGARCSAGVETIEHGDDGTPEVFKLMAEHHVALCPTLAAGDATCAVRRLEEGQQPEPPRHRAQARQLQGGARRRRDDPQRQRRRRVPARRQRARARADGGLRHAPRRRAEDRDLDRRAACCT